MVRRRVVSAAFAVVAFAAAALAIAPPATPAVSAVPAASRQVLTPRRVPDLLAQVAGDARLRRALDAVLADPALGPARDLSCIVVEERGRRVYERSATAALVPASNLKLLTAFAVLERLGPDLRLPTEVRVAPSATPGDGVVDGPLWLVGGGDPLVATSDYAASLPRQPQLRSPLESLADQVVASGVRAVTGGVLGDESRYDRQRYVPSWKPEYVRDAEVGPASALTVNDNFARWTPRREAAPAPAANAAAVLAALLVQRGVAVGMTPGEGAAPADARALAVLESPPMAEIVGQMLRESDNLTAELLVKELGRRHRGAGSTEAGLGVVAETLAAAGVEATGLVARDGSGLDRANRATCEALVDVLAGEGDDSWLARGLPVAARDGTLADRFHGTPAAGRVRAKTGRLDNVAGLSGWVDARDGRRLAFAVLANGLPLRAAPGRDLVDRVAVILAGYPEAPAPEELAP